MPTHVRAQIRAAFAALVTGLATTGSRVLVGRTRPLGKDAQPTLLIYSTDEPADVTGMGAPPTIERMLTVLIEARVSAASPPDDTLDQIALEVETAIGANQKLSGLVKEITLVASRVRTQAQGENHIGELSMEFRVTYHTREGAPATAV